MIYGISDTALHEAAHAVIGHALGIRVMKLTVVPERTRGGGWLMGHIITRRKGRDCPVTVGAMILAGHEAEVLWRGREVTVVPAGDHKDVQRLGISSRGVNVLRIEVIRALKIYRKTIFKVARELDRKRTMSRKQFLETVGW